MRAALFSGAFAGAILGMTVMTPLGVHVMNRHRGAYWPNLLASAVAAAGTVFTISQVESGYRPHVLVGGAVVQIGVSTLVERITSAR